MTRNGESTLLFQRETFGDAATIGSAICMHSIQIEEQHRSGSVRCDPITAMPPNGWSKRLIERGHCIRRPRVSGVATRGYPGISDRIAKWSAIRHLGRLL